MKTEIEVLREALEGLLRYVGANDGEPSVKIARAALASVPAEPQGVPISFTFCPRCGDQMNPKHDASAPQVDTTLEQIGASLRDHWDKVCGKSAMCVKVANLADLVSAHARKSQPTQTVNVRAELMAGLAQEMEVRCRELYAALKLAHDAMFSWCSSEYASHPTSKKVAAELDRGIIPIRAAESAAVPNLEKELADALRPFAKNFTGDLSQVGGGTLTAVSFPIQVYKNAKAAYARFDAKTEGGK